MDKRTEKAIKRLNNHFLFGASIRRKGALSLMGTSIPDAVEPLIGLIADKNEKVRESAHKALTSLKGVALNEFCRMWSDKRTKELETIMLQAYYLATEPEQLMALTTFVQGRKLNASIRKEALYECLLDRDERIVANAVVYSLENLGENPHDILWPLILEHSGSPFIKVLLGKGWHPDDPSERALFYFLAGDLAKYLDIDFDQAHLRYWHETGSQTMKDAIASRIRKSGDSRLLSVFRTERGGRKEKLGQRDIDIQIEILLKKREYAELFKLLPMANYEQGRHIINGIRQAGWRNPDGHGLELQKRVEATVAKTDKARGPSSYAMAIYRDFRPMFLGELKVPSDGPELLSWLNDNKEFRRRSAALITLAEKNSPGLGDAANKACGDKYWQVRMAAAASELLRPGTLSPANKALLEGDHVHWVQSLLKMPHAGRLADLGPDGLEALRTEGKRSDPKKMPDRPDNFFDLLKGMIPSAEKEYLLVLGEYLGTDITVSEDVSYAAGDTDAEIEFE